MAENSEDLMLENEILIGDLIGGGASFTLRSNYQSTDDDEELFPELMTGEEGKNLDTEMIVSPWDRPFAELVPLMTDEAIHVEDIDKKIYKKMIQKPVDNVEIKGRCRVTIDYNAYHEQQACPFDSTFLRGENCTFITDDSAVLPGLEIAVKSMKRGEESQFIIPFELLYGKLGCEPRIKKEADALFVIHLIKFSVVGDLEATENVPNEDKRKYKVMIEKIMEVKTSGIDNFRQGAYVKAASAFHRAIDRLQMCQLSNEEEEKEQQQHLITLYINVMTCYNKIDRPKKVCSAFNELIRLTDTNKNPKALFQHGKALIMLGDFKRARENLLKANRLKPNDSEIVKQLKNVDTKYTNFKNAESGMWRRAIGNEEPITLEGCVEVSDKFKAAVNEVVTEFKNNPKESTKNIPTRLSEDEKTYIRDLIKDMEMKLVIQEVQGTKRCYLTKT